VEVTRALVEAPRSSLQVLFVCTGNICRSPTAEAVLRELGRKEGVPLHVESRGTHDYHVGQPPDERAQHHARRRGYDLSALRARELTRRDFEEFDLILAMDQGTLACCGAGVPPNMPPK